MLLVIVLLFSLCTESPYHFFEGNNHLTDTAVKLLPCDHEVMGSSPGNSFLHKGTYQVHMAS
jgi:hypothetical protein